MTEASTHCSGCENCMDTLKMVVDEAANHSPYLKDSASLALIVTFRHIRRDSEIPGLTEALRTPSSGMLTKLPF